MKRGEPVLHWSKVRRIGAWGQPRFPTQIGRNLLRHRATDGKKLWELDAGTGIMAPPATYLRDGVQYVTLWLAGEEPPD